MFQMVLYMMSVNNRSLSNHSRSDSMLDDSWSNSVLDYSGCNSLLDNSWLGCSDVLLVKCHTSSCSGGEVLERGKLVDSMHSHATATTDLQGGLGQGVLLHLQGGLGSKACTTKLGKSTLVKKPHINLRSESFYFIGVKIL